VFWCNHVGMADQSINATLVWWQDGDWYVGKLEQYPGVCSQGATLEELKVNIQEAYHLLFDAPGDSDLPVGSAHVHRQELHIA